MVCWGSDEKNQKRGEREGHGVRRVSKEEVIVLETIFTYIYRLIQMPCNSSSRLIFIISVRLSITSPAPVLK